MTGVTVQNVISFRLACHYVISFLFLVFFAQNGSHASKSRKYCPSSEIEVLSNRGVKIEPLAKSRVEVTLVHWFGLRRNMNGHRTFMIRLSFKTTSPNGILFYATNPTHPTELIAITLQNGRLYYIIRCPNLHADLLVPTRDRHRVDDGLWHNVTYSVKYTLPRFNKIAIDGYTNSKRYEATCSPVKYVVLGGLSTNVPTIYASEFQSLGGHFEGCIKNLRIPSPFTMPPTYYAVSSCG